MPRWSERTKRIDCRHTTVERVVYFNGYDTGAMTGDRGVVWSDFASQRSRDWVRTPNYKALKNAGALPDNAMNYEAVSITSKPTVIVREGENTSGGKWDAKSYYYLERYSHTFPPRVPQYTVIDLKPYIAQAKLKAIKAAKSNQFNAPVFAAEAKKTANMVHDRARQLAQILLDLRRGDIGRAITRLHPQFEQRVTVRRRGRIVRRFNRTRFSNPSKAVADAWLEMRYGWIPFMSEVRSAVNTFLDVADDPRNRICHVREYARASERSTQVNKAIYWREYGSTIEASDEVSIRVLWKFRPKSADLPGRFGLVNPAEVAWELIPLSFVVDWFIPVGDYLAALDAPMRFEHVGGVVGIKQRLKRTLTLSGSQWYSHVEGECTAERLLVSVDPISSVPIPSLTDTATFSLGLGASRVASAIALLRQAIPRKS